MDRRREKRSVAAIPAQFHAGAQAGVGEICSFSKLGLFVRTGELPAPGDPISVVFDTPTGQKVEVVGHVRWTTDQLPAEREPQSGFGMLIDEWSDDYHDWFERLLFA